MAVDLSKYIKSVKIETAFLPDINIADPFKSGGAPNPILQALRPKITVDTAIGEQTLAPYGEPGATLWPVLRNFLIVAGIGFMIKRILK